MLDDVDCTEALLHFLGMPWKLFFALIPPRHMCGGWAAFFIALSLIGVVTCLVGELATILGCTIGLRVSATAITLVAMGTSLPDTFASKTAAQTSEYADAAVGNVTGSNSVNVFLGMGLPWVLGAWYWKDKFDADYEQPAGALAFSVIIFLICSLLCFLILICRRCTVGGELGGPKGTKYFTAILCFLLWAVYLSVSLCQIYEVFEVPESVLGPKFYSDRYPDKYPKLETADATVDEEEETAVLLQSMPYMNLAAASPLQNELSHDSANVLYDGYTNMAKYASLGRNPSDPKQIAAVAQAEQGYTENMHTFIE